MDSWDVCFKDWTDVLKKRLQRCEVWLRKWKGGMCALRTGQMCLKNWDCGNVRCGLGKGQMRCVL